MAQAIHRQASVVQVTFWERLQMRYLFCTLASHGYVYPALGIALELRRRGHTIAFVTGRSFQGEIEAAGLLYLPYEYDNPQLDSFEVKSWAGVRGVHHQIQHVTAAATIFEPDVIVTTQLTLGPLIVARRTGRWPVAVIGFSTYLWPTATSFANEALDELSQMRAVRHREMLDNFAQLCLVFGAPLPAESLTDYRCSPLLGDLFLLRTIAQLEGPITDFPPQVHFVGDCLWEPPLTMDPALQQDLASWVTDTAHPIIYVQHTARWTRPYQQNGKQMPAMKDFWPDLMSVLGALPSHVLAVTDHPPFLAAQYPDHIHVRSHIPHQWVLPHAAMIITTGTTSTMLGALTQGVPMLLITVGSENDYVGEMCEREGVAHRLFANQVTAVALRQAIQAVLTSSRIRQRAQVLQAAFQAYGGPGYAVDLIERLVAAPAPVQTEAPFTATMRAPATLGQVWPSAL